MHATDIAPACRVMVVDDDARIHAAVAAVLSGAGVNFVSAEPDQLEAVLASYQPTIVLLDLSMPALDGIQALNLLRAKSFAGRVAVMSGSNRDLIETARRVGQSYGLHMTQGLQKPFRAKDLLEVVRSEDTAAPAIGLESEIGRAFSQGEICFHYQPKFDLRTRALAGFESLVRWQHPTKGLLMPGAILDQVAVTGHKADLARVALSDAVARLAAWQTQGWASSISFNVALDEATDPAFLVRLTAAVNAMSAPPSSLVIELLESAADLDLCAAAGTLTRARLLGVGISIDDFGTQSSSLARLQHLPANELKIDRSFVANLRKFKHDQIIVRSVIGMAHQLGLNVVAEGIEDEATLDLLLEMGCTHGQGFYLARPLAREDAGELLARHTRTRAAAAAN